MSAIVDSPPGALPLDHNFKVDLSMHDFSADFQDHFITLGIRNTNTNASYNFYTGSDLPVSQQPVILITTCE